LGHIISVQGITAYSKKIEDMNDWLTLKDLTRLRGFLGLTGYYICKKLWQNCEPSNTIIEKKRQLRWGPETQQAFQELKKAMVTIQVLAVPSFSKLFELGTILSQEARLVAYMSHKLSEWK